MNHESLHESLHCVWHEHGIYFGSRVREEYDNDPKLQELCDEFEEAWRNLNNEVLERENVKEQFKEEVLYPLVKEEIKRLL